MNAIDLDVNDSESININDINKNADIIDNLDIDNNSNNSDNDVLNIKNNNKKLEKLEYILSNKKKQTACNYLQYWVIHKYFVYLDVHKLGKIQASERIAKEVYNKGSYQARNI